MTRGTPVLVGCCMRGRLGLELAHVTLPGKCGTPRIVLDSSSQALPWPAHELAPVDALRRAVRRKHGR